jgi:hypothetical protein
VDLESAAAEEWNADADHAAAPLRAAVEACISLTLPCGGGGGGGSSRVKTNRSPQGADVCGLNKLLH